jgi:hypothetical protein
MENNKMTYKESFTWTFIIIAFLIGFIVLTHLLNIKGYWGGLLFLWFFGLNGMIVNKIPEIVLGGVVGISIAYFISNSPFEGAGGLLVLVAILVIVITLIIREQFPKFINQSTALTLTIFTFPSLSSSSMIIDGLLGFIVGAIYYGICTWLLSLVNKEKEEVESVQAK